MGKQGKGILGGFSGKVANVVGAKIRDKDTIRKAPPSRNHPQFFKPIYELANFVNISNTTVGAGFALNSGAVENIDVKAEVTQSISTKNGGYIWKLNDLTKTTTIGLDKEQLPLPASAYMSIITSNAFFLIIACDLEDLIFLAPPVVNEVYEVRYMAGELWFMRDFGTGKTERITVLNCIENGSLVMAVNPFIFGSGIIDVSVGKSANT